MLRFKSFSSWLLVVFCLAVSGCGSVELYTGLQEKEANEMMAILLDSGISCHKQAGEEGTWDLAVSKSHFALAVERLKELGFPRDSFADIGEIFKKSGLVSSPSEERIRFMYALSQEISHTLSRIDGVLNARVHIVLPDNNPFGEAVRPSSAAVFIKHRANAELESSIPEIQEFVIASIEGLKLENVKVALFEAREVVSPRRPANGGQGNMAEVLSISVARESVNRLWAILGGVGGVGILGLVAAGSAWLRTRQK